MASVDRSEFDSMSMDDFCKIAQDVSQKKRLEQYLGSVYYRDLSEALRSPTRSRRSGSAGTVVLLHGIMGSQIGKKNVRVERDVVWLNPLAIQEGNLENLKIVSGRSSYGPRGFLPMIYSLLWARLKYWYGYEVLSFAYDWRMGIRESALRLAEFIDQETSGPFSFVAHSMGGLVVRVALPQLGHHAIQRVIQLATPNYGSFSPVQTFCGGNKFVNRILALDTTSSLRKQLTETISTFQGLCELMPAPSRFSALDLFDVNNWPAPQTVKATVLNAAKAGIQAIPEPDPRLILIAGRNQDTITEVTSLNGGFQFRSSNSGDGTVPLAFARFEPTANIPTYTANVTHTGILASKDIAAAIDDLLRTGITQTLERDSGMQPTRKSQIVDCEFGETRGSVTSSADLAQAMREFMGPIEPESDRATCQRGSDGGRDNIIGDVSDGGGRQSRLDRVVVGRWRRRIRFTLKQGDATKVPAHAHLLGVFEGVMPSGAAVAYDELMSGALNDLFTRRMFSGTRGSVYVLPTYKTPVPGEMIVFAGLGRFEDFNPKVVEDVFSQVVQSLLRVRVTELVTVLIGGSAGKGDSSDWMKDYLQSLLSGFIRGLVEADHRFEFQRLILCESDPDKYKQLGNDLYELAASRLFDDVEVEFDIPPRDKSLFSEPVLNRTEPVYFFSNLLIDGVATDDDSTYRHEISVLAPSSGVGVPKRVTKFSKRKFDQLMRRVADGAPSDLDQFSHELTDLVFPKELGEQCSELVAENAVQLVHNSLSARIPWEAVLIGKASPAILKGFSRKYQSTQTAAAVSESQRRNKKLRVLLVYDPSSNLPKAADEGKRILALASKYPNTILEAVPLRGPDAEHSRIIQRLRDEDFDILHYAGHAQFVQENPSQSGLVCARGEVLSGTDLVPLGSRLPPLIIFNACESIRTRKLADEVKSDVASAAEAILNAGIMCFIGTFWPVVDDSAGMFAEVFYDSLLKGIGSGQVSETIGQSVLAARQALKEDDQKDWADYILYGNPDFTLKFS
jgi:pimeloyl-ACP methyl ester carboxylesterase